LVIEARPEEATVSVTKAAHLLGVHPNTIRTWTQQGRLHCLRINTRGDRRYPLAEIQRFIHEASRGALTQLSRAASHPPAGDADSAEVARLRAQLDQEQALRRIGADISSKLDLDTVLEELADHAMLLFHADRAAVAELKPGGDATPRVTRNLSRRYIDFAKQMPTPSLPAQALQEGRPLFAVGYASDPRGAGVRAAVIQEGFDTIAAAPLLVRGSPAGLLMLYHDQPHAWSADEMDVLEVLAGQASLAFANARDFAQMATWAAQLQSIQQLGARLSRLRKVDEIGTAIATELRQLIDYHNVRVYLVQGEDCVPVAWQGHMGAYDDEVADQLRTTVGHGITGWVAQHGVAINVPDAARDPRGRTILGTEEDLAESMLAAPMSQEDSVIGVIVLSKLGLHQFTPDDLRLLEIYASFAAQAMSNADATERLAAQSAALEHQLRRQRELLRLTETLLSSLNEGAILEEVAARLRMLFDVENLAVHLLTAGAAVLQPVVARGSHADLLMAHPVPVRGSFAGEVALAGEARLMEKDPANALRHPTLTAEPGTLMAVPLRGRERVVGVITLERSAAGGFSPDEFELVQLFAAQASIALQNAEVYRAIELRAETDALTGLANPGSFHERLAHEVARGEVFSLLMLDLDDFKAFNDRRGHQAGDRLLRSIALGIRSAGRDSDLVFRYGGDEFAVILPNTDSAGALAVAEKVRLQVQSTSRDEGGRSPVTCSIGVAAYPDDGATKDELLLAADRACYVVKRGRKNRVVTAAEGLDLAAEFLLTEPTPVDLPVTTASAA